MGEAANIYIKVNTSEAERAERVLAAVELQSDKLYKSLSNLDNNSDFGKLNKAVDGTGSSMGKLKAANDDAVKSVNDFSRDVGTAAVDVDKHTDTMKRGFDKLKLAVAAVFAAGVGFVTSSLNTFREMEAMEASMKTVTGSAEAAAEAMETVKDFAKETPFTLEQSVQGFIKLKSLGLDPSAEALRSYGNTAAAMGKDMNQMVEAVADATTMEFERLKEFGIKAKQQGDDVTFTFQGVSTTVRKEAGAIEGYLLDIGNVQFASAMADQMDTVNGALSNAEDAFNNFKITFIEETGIDQAFKKIVISVSDALTEMSDKIGPFVDDVQTFITQFKNAWEDIDLPQTQIDKGSDALQTFVGAIKGVSEAAGAVGDFLSPVMPALRTFAGVFSGSVGTWAVVAGGIGLVSSAVGVLATALIANPIGATIAAIGTAAYLIYDNWEGITQWWGELWGDVQKAVQSALDWWDSAVEFVVNFEMPSVGDIIQAALNLHERVFDALLNAAEFVFGIELPTAAEIVQGARLLISNVLVWWDNLDPFEFQFDMPSAGEIVVDALALHEKVFDALLNVAEFVFGVELPTVAEIVAKGVEFIAGIQSWWDSVSLFEIDIQLPSVSGFVSGAGDKVAGIGDWLGRKFGDIGDDTADGLVNTLEDRTDDVAKATQDMAEVIEPTARKVLKTQSPSKIMAAIGYDVALGLAGGIEDGTGQVRTAAEEAAYEIEKSVQRIVGGLEQQYIKLSQGDEAARRYQLAGDGIVGTNADMIISAENHIQTLENQKAANDEFYNSLVNSIKNADSVKDVFDNLGDYLKNWLKEQIAHFAANKIVAAIGLDSGGFDVGGLFGGGGSTAGIGSHDAAANSAASAAATGNALSAATLGWAAALAVAAPYIDDAIESMGKMSEFPFGDVIRSAQEFQQWMESVPATLSGTGREIADAIGVLGAEAGTEAAASITAAMVDGIKMNDNFDIAQATAESLLEGYKQAYELLGPQVQSLVDDAIDIDTATADEIAEAFNNIAITAELMLPSLEAVGLVMGESTDEMVASSNRLAEALGGPAEALKLLDLYAREFVPAGDLVNVALQDSKKSVDEFNASLKPVPNAFEVAGNVADRLSDSLKGTTTSMDNFTNLNIDMASSMLQLGDATIDTRQEMYEYIEGLKVLHDAGAITTEQYESQAAAALEMLPAIIAVEDAQLAQIETLETVSEASRNLNLTFDAMSPVAQESANALVELMGGIEGFSAATANYYDKFYTEEEKKNLQLVDSAAQVASFNDMLGNTGDAVIDTREEFRTYVEGLDLTTEAGRQAYAQALEVADSMYVVAEAGDAHAQAMQDLHNSQQEQIVALGTVRDVARDLNLQFDATAPSAIDASNALIEMMGGLDAFTAANQNYYNTFFDEKEREQIALTNAAADVRNFNEALGRTGEAAIDTREEFRAYVEGLDLTTEAGRRQYAQALEVVDSMGLVVEAGKDVDGIMSEMPDNLKENFNEMTDVTKDTAEEIAQKNFDINNSQLEAATTTEQIMQGMSEDMHKRFDEMSEISKQSSDAMADAAQESNDRLVDVLNRLVLVLDDTDTQATQTMQNMRDVVTGHFTNMSTTSVTSVGQITDALGLQADANYAANDATVIQTAALDGLKGVVAASKDPIETATTAINNNKNAFGTMRDNAVNAAGAISNVSGAIDGMKSQFEGAKGAIDSLASKVRNGIGGLGNIGVTNVLGSFEVGTNYVPQTGLYELHQGEIVIPPDLSAQIRALGVASNASSFASTATNTSNSSSSDVSVSSELRAELRANRRELEQTRRELSSILEVIASSNGAIANESNLQSKSLEDIKREEAFARRSAARASKKNAAA